MALSINEGTPQEVMSIFKMPGGYTPGYVRIVHLNVNWNDPSFNALVMMYASKEAREENPDGGHKEYIGGSLPSGAVELMKEADDRDVLYKYIQAFVMQRPVSEEYTAKIKAETDEQKKNDLITEYNLKLAEIYDILKIPQL